MIGSGHNGLTCACYLARAGLKVLVLEQYPSIGGMTNTEELTLPGYFSDSHALGYQLANVSPAPRELGLAAHGFELLYPEIGYSHVFPDGTSITGFRDLERTCYGIARFSNRDAGVYRNLCDLFASNIDAFAEALHTPPDTPAEHLAALESGRGGLDAYRFELQSFRSWAGESLEAEQTGLLLGSWCCHLGLSPDDVGGANAAVLFATLIQAFGNNLVRGGMANLPRALAADLRAHGGEIRTNADVDKVIVENGNARGLRLADGERIDVGGLVVSNVDPQQLGLRLIGEDVLGSRIAAKLRRYEPGESTLVIYLALDGPVEFKAGADAARSPYVHPAPSLAYLSRQFQECRSGLLPATPFALLCNDSACDPSRAPEGKALMKFVVQPVPYVISGDAGNTIDGRSWGQVKEVFADRVIGQFTADYIPDLSRKIVHRTVLSPIDQETLLPSAVRGTTMHGAFLPYQSGAMRPIPEMGRYRTPVENVYLCGSGSHPGGGVSMAPGRNAAQVICRDLSLTFPPS